MALLPVADALERLLADAGPVDTETVPLSAASGRVLAVPLAALRTQPPFPASAMDGYAVRAADIVSLPARLTVIGVAAAGRRFAGVVGPACAVRIFTGAPVPESADTIAIQENVKVVGGDVVEVREPVVKGAHIRRPGLDFSQGDILLERGRVMDPAALALAAAANHPRLAVLRKPIVAIIATGDELLPPGSEAGPDQIIASNPFGVAAIVEAAGGRALDLGIAADRTDAISTLVERALQAKADVIVTLGGASVGDHDLVNEVLEGLGMRLDFWRIAMRPGKPLMFGRLGKTRCIGLPGNPVASLVCATLFLQPLLARLGGRIHVPRRVEAVLAAALPANDVREDYVRARLEPQSGGLLATPFPIQDSSMLKLLADAGGLIVRKPFAPEARPGDRCDVLLLR
ncbi:MAG: molybdenum cofactor biosynthesis protein [Rhizobiaceae bacterium]|nr:molybdenum cofactor biosynthesis protein [Rhizobiaceae bacterium]